MDEFVGMGFESLSCFRAKLVFACAAPFAATVDEGVRDVAEANVAFDGLELTRRITAVRILRAIERSPRDERGQLGRRDTEYLFVKNMIDSGLQVWYLIGKSRDQPFRDLPQEHPALAANIEERCLAAPKELLRQHIKHLVHYRRRGKHLVVRKVRQTAQHVGIVEVLIHNFIFAPLCAPFVAKIYCLVAKRHKEDTKEIA